MLLTSSVAQAWILGAIAILFGSLLGLMSLWTVNPRAHWSLRWGAVAVVFAIVAAIPAPELVLLAAVELAVVWIGTLAGRLIARRRAALPEQIVGEKPARLRFSLQSVLLFVGVAAIYIADYRFVRGLQVFYRLDAAVLGALCGVIALASYWAVSQPGRKPLRWACAILIAAACGGLLDLGVCGSMGVLTGQFSRQFVPTSILAINLMANLTLWRWPARQVASSNTAAAACSRRFLKLPRVAGVALALLMVGLLAPLYYDLVRPAEMPAIDTTSPNAHHALVKLGIQSIWTAMPSGDELTATPAQLAKYLEQNAGLLRDAKRLIRQPCWVPLAFTAKDIAGGPDGFTGFREDARLFQAEARLAHLEGRWQACARAGLDMVRLGREESNGGLEVNRIYGDSHADMGAVWIQKVLDQLDSQAWGDVLRELVALEQTGESPEVIDAREDTWKRLVFHEYWPFRLESAIQKIIALPLFCPTIPPHFGVNRGLAHLRLLIVELALREYVARKGVPPDALEQLVPECLAAVPLDPFSGKPFCYRRAEQGWLLYNAGPDGVDNGGNGAFAPALTPGTDLFLSGFDVPDENNDEDDANDSAGK